MKTSSIWIVAPQEVEIREIDVADPGPREVQVRCLANGICMLEVSVYKGTERWYPFLAGHEGIGVVTKVGREVIDIKEGDTVPCRQWQQLANVRADGLPTFRQAPADPALVIWEPVDCVIRALRAYAIQPGDRVLLTGAGYMGLLNVQGLARYPLTELVVSDVNPDRLVLAKAFGATGTIVAGTPEGDARLEALTAQPFDLVIEASGALSALQRAGDLTRAGGRLAIFAWHHGERTVNMTPWHLRGLHVINAAPGIATDYSMNTMERTVRMIEAGIFDQSRLITHRHPAGRVREALDLALRRPPEFIKGVLDFATWQ